MSKVAELIGAELDYWVAMAGEEWKSANQHFPTMTLDSTFKSVVLGRYPRGEYGSMVPSCILVPNNEFRQDRQPYAPSIWWEQGGPLIERERIELFCNTSPRVWTGFITTYPTDRPHFTDQCSGETPLIAAMRTIVTKRFGNEVPA